MKISSMTAEDRVRHLTEAPIPGLILELSLPTVISMLVTSLYNMVDTAFVGQLNTQSTAAVGVSFSAMALLQAVSFFFGHGSGNYISRKLGAREYENAERMAATSFFRRYSAAVCWLCWAWCSSRRFPACSALPTRSCPTPSGICA